jgi:hypothetical protein
LTGRLVRIVAVVSLLASTVLLVPARAQAAGSQRTCTPAVATATPFGTTPCPGVRPGAFVEVPTSNTTCTLGFLLRDVRNRRSYMTTAGHCALPAAGRRTWQPDKGPPARAADGKKIGTVAFAEIRGTVDFALVLLARGTKPTAQVCHFGGPTGLNDEYRGDPAVLEYYGQGQALSSVVPARSGVAANTQDPDYLYAQAPISLGDSGGPWMTDDGRAIGYLTHIVGYGPAPSTEVSVALVRRLGPQLEAAERALQTKLTLVTAPRIP